MRIALITPSDGPQAPVMVARHLVHGLTNAGAKAQLYYLRRATAQPHAGEQPLRPSDLAAVLAEHEIVHTHGLRPDFLVGFGRLLIGRRRARWISTLHCDMETDLIDLHGPWLGARASSLWQWVRRRTDGQVFLSNSIAQRYASVPQHIVIPNGLPPAPADALQPDAEVLQLLQRARQGHILVGTLANTRPLKRIDLMIHALALATDWQFVHFGDGPERVELQALAARIGVASRCHFLGHRPEAVLYLPHLHAYLNASLTEASPLSVLEAMRAGTPIVAPRIAPFTELLAEQPDQLFDPGSEASLVATVRAATIRAEPIGAWQRRQFHARYTAATMAELHLAFYRAVLTNSVQTAAYRPAIRPHQ